MTSSSSARRTIDDREIDRQQREHLAQFTTPRRALDGRLVWLIDEIEQRGAD